MTVDTDQILQVNNFPVSYSVLLKLLTTTIILHHLPFSILQTWLLCQTLLNYDFAWQRLIICQVVF